MIKFSFNHFLVQRKKSEFPWGLISLMESAFFFLSHAYNKTKKHILPFLGNKKITWFTIWYVNLIQFFCVLFFSEGSWIKPVIQKISQRCGIKQNLNTKNKSVPYQPISGMAFTSNKLEASTCICIYIVPLKSLTSSLEILQMAHHSCKSTWI